MENNKESAAKHTPGLLRISTGHDRWIVRDKGGPIACVEQDQDVGTGNARRIVACWNACDGVPTEILEAAGAKLIPPDVPYQVLEQQRDELMSALEDVMPLLLERYKHNLEKHSGTKHAALLKAEREFKNASAAIAKAKGSK